MLRAPIAALSLGSQGRQPILPFLLTFRIMAFFSHILFLWFVVLCQRNREKLYLLHLPRNRSFNYFLASPNFCHDLITFQLEMGD